MKPRQALTSQQPERKKSSDNLKPQDAINRRSQREKYRLGGGAYGKIKSTPVDGLAITSSNIDDGKYNYQVFGLFTQLFLNIIDC